MNKKTEALIDSAWDYYVGERHNIPDHIEGVRDMITQSWKTSILTADPYDTNPETLPWYELEEALKRNESLIDIALPYLKDFYTFLAGSNQQVLLTDAKGRQLANLSDDRDLLIKTKEAKVKDGGIYTEAVTGTTAVALCLQRDELVITTGKEHFRKAFHGFTCMAAPIHNSSGKLIGCICILCAKERFQSSMKAALYAAQKGIEKELLYRQNHSILVATLETVPGGLIILDSDHRILYANDHAKRLLKLDSRISSDEQVRLEDWIQLDSMPPALRSLDTKTASTDCTLLNYKGEPCPVFLSITMTKEAEQRDKTILITMQEQNEAYRFTTQMAGFTASYTFDSIIGEGTDILRLKDMGKSMASSDANILIYGENGTGKHMFAQALHNTSRRAAGPFVSIACASIPKEQIEAELLGIESVQGNKPGKIELASGGTLYLDEVSSLSLSAQSILLQVVERRQVQRLGSSVPRPADVRIIASTNTNLLTLVQERTFRNDLYYRLNILSIILPPLHQRTEDIPVFTEHFLRRYRDTTHRFNAQAMEALMKYPWPGNIRELENVIERVINMNPGPIYTVQDLPSEISNYYLSSRYVTHAKTHTIANEYPVHDRKISSEIISPEIQEYNKIIDALKEERGHVKTVALKLGMPVSTLYRKLAKYQLDPKDYRVWSPY